MLACRIHAKEDLRIESVATPDPGPGEVLLRLGAGGICGSDLHYYFEGRNGSFVVREPLIPGHEASAVVEAIGAGRHAREEGRQGRGVAVARLRSLRGLPRGPRAAVHQHALPRQREPVPARAGHVPGTVRDGRAAVLPGRRRHHAGRARVRRAARRRPARGEPRRRPARQVGARHRRRHDRLRHRDGRAARGRAEDHRHRRARSAARRRRSSSAPTSRCARIATARRSARRSSTSATRSRATSTRSSPASRPSSAAASSSRSARCRTSRCRSSSTR